MVWNMFQGFKIINDFSKTEVKKWYEYNRMNMREEIYVNVLADQDKSKLSEQMKNNKLHLEA